MAALMASTSAFAGVKVQARVSTKATRVNTVTTANAGGPKRVSARGRVKHAGDGCRGRRRGAGAVGTEGLCRMDSTEGVRKGCFRSGSGVSV